MTEIVNDYRALLSGQYWGGLEVTNKPTIVTFSFPTSAADYVATMPGFTAATAASFQAFTAAEQAQARAALKEWSDASGIIFIEVAPGQGDLNFQNVDLATTSYSGKGGVGFYPFGGWDFASYPSFRGDADGSGDVFMNSAFLSGGEVDYGTLLHEIGHAIGLKHPDEDVFNGASGVDHDEVLASDDPSLTIMSHSADTSSGPQHLKQLDKDAAAFIYGAAGTGRTIAAGVDASGANSSVSHWTWTAATQTLGQTGFAGDDTIRGSSVTDVIDGLGGDNRLFGLAGNDTLTSGSGNDMLDGGTGADSMTGGAGNDTYIVDNAGDMIVEAAGGGIDWVYGYADVTLAANVENLQIFGQFTGTGNDLDNVIYGDGTLANTLIGAGGGDYMVGGKGGDTLNGGVGADTMYGQLGDDTYFVDNAGDYVGENAGEGTDTVDSKINWTLGANLENLTLIGTGAISGAGNALDNVITGIAAANSLSGNDGNDTLDGGAGADKMTGGAGNDTYYVDNSADTVIEANGGGTDIVYASASFAMGSQFIETVMLTGSADIDATGNGQANTLNGNGGDNVLDGAGGADRMAGGGGDDGYYVDNAGDVVVEAAGGGSDTVYSTISYATPANVERIVLLGSAAINAAGNGLDNVMTGNAAANSLSGGDGNDTLDGGAGIDRLTGGTGNDTYYVDSSSDVVIETGGAGSGNDIVYASASYSIVGQFIETLVLTGSGNISATGNTQANTLIGNSGANVLNGGAGIDSMAGGAGDDSYSVDNAADTVTEAVGEGTDAIYASVSYALPANVERIVLTGTAAINATGNGLDNVMTGNGAANSLSGGDGNDTLDGGAGADKLTGGAGNDIYYIDSSSDAVIEAAAGGTDIVYASASFSLAGQFVETLALTGAASINATGNSQANIFVGNGGDNVFTGAGGADAFQLGIGFGHDTITDFGAGSASGHDTVAFAGGIFASFTDMMSHAAQSGSDVLISASGGDTLTLKNMTLGKMASADFTFG